MFTGYNAEQITILGERINAAAYSVGQLIPEKLRRGIILPIASAWYAPEAVKFFNDFAQSVNSMGHIIQEAYDSFRIAVQEAAVNWVDNTGGTTYPEITPVRSVSINLSVSDIKESNNGNVGINETLASSIARSLSQVQSEIMDEIQRTNRSLAAESAFLGGGQAVALEECFMSVSRAVSRLFSFLAEGDASLQAQINKAVQKYQDVSSGITSAFNVSK